MLKIGQKALKMTWSRLMKHLIWPTKRIVMSTTHRFTDKFMLILAKPKNSMIYHIINY